MNTSALYADPKTVRRGKPTAELIASSINEYGQHLRTFSVKGHHLILPQMNTHRADSRSIQSGRAVPTMTFVRVVLEDIAYPVYYGSNQKGMVAGEENLSYIAHPVTGEMLPPDEAWRRMAEDASKWCEQWANAGYHKQIATRPLTPFSYYRGTVSSTCRDNFYGLRRHVEAQPEIRTLADAMWEAEKSAPPPKLLRPGEWHTPWIEPEDHETVEAFLVDNKLDRDLKVMLINLVSAARCARSSYTTYDGRRSAVVQDLQLCAKLIQSEPLHASPFEAVATPDEKRPVTPYRGSESEWCHPEDHRNFKGFRQLRAYLERGQLDTLLSPQLLASLS